MQNIGSTLSKYAMPALLALFGLLLLITSAGQTHLYKLGSIGILVVGVLATFYVKGTIPAKAQALVAIVVTLGALAFAYLDYAVIDDELSAQKKREKVETNVVQRLKDIRKAQLAYSREFGNYTNNFDTLLDFLQNGHLTLVKRLGSLPDSVPSDEEARELGLISEMPDGMSDEDVLAAGLIIRDTIEVDVLTYVFNESDTRTRKTRLYIDSLPFVPYGKHKFEMAIAKVEVGGVEQNAFQVIDPKPYSKQFKVGSLTSASTAGNWGAE
jgi:hypothetical protein